MLSTFILLIRNM